MAHLPKSFLGQNIQCLFLHFFLATDFVYEARLWFMGHLKTLIHAKSSWQMTYKTKTKPATSTGQKHQSIWCNFLWSPDTALTQFLIISLFMWEQRSDIKLLRHCYDSSAKQQLALYHIMFMYRGQGRAALEPKEFTLGFPQLPRPGSRAQLLCNGPGHTQHL